ncbi:MULTISPECIES: hypothetical protein [unclassified Gilliamella]|uniref:hypothetical protein n=1 Tax=unclassified Gilliamella TaxID=2685620 RepID=UPI0022697FC0|nr:MULTISPECIES: hypothetical protein [unclassified Gilliamella]MCX8585801.1 hypothetical protein [Gilliamella sp. B3562]MCX8684893.1 hypothetical protein [Gilliamella sp. B2864]
MVFFLPFSGHALTSQTTRNAIQGSVPYLTFDGGRTRAVDANGLLGITLSNGANYTPSNNSSSTTPITLPVVGQSFADIRMFVPTNTNSVALSSLIGPPNNYWGDDDGDSGVTATGYLSLSIVDKNNESVSRSTVPTICKAPYKVTLSSSDGTLSTRYGFPNRSTFNASNVTYYVNPKASPVVCFARPNLKLGKRGDDRDNPSWDFAGPSSMWDPANGFIPQSTGPSSYGRNFPTTGANKLYFDLLISGVSQPLSWSPVSLGGITATMSNSTATSVRVTLTGPYATEFQHNSDSPSPISKPTLPQTFELVGRDSNGTPVARYGFTLKQWFVNRGSVYKDYSNTFSWCNSLGYRLVNVKDLTNAVRTSDGVISGATPSSSGNYYQRRIGSGFFTEWGRMYDYSGAGFVNTLYNWYWTSDPRGSYQFIVTTDYGDVNWYYPYYDDYGLCSYP